MWMKWVAVLLHAAIFQEPLQYHGRMSRGTFLQKEPIALLSKLYPPSQILLQQPLHHWYVELNIHWFSDWHKFFLYHTLLIKCPNQKYLNFIFCKKNFVGLGDDLATLVSPQNNPFEVIFPYVVSSSPLHALIFCFRRDLEHPTLTYSIDATDSVFWSDTFVTFCSSCTFVKLCRMNFMHIFLFSKCS